EEALAGEPELRRPLMHRRVVQVVERLDEVVAETRVLDQRARLLDRVGRLARKPDEERPARDDALALEPADAALVHACDRALRHVLQDLVRARLDAEEDALAAAARDLPDQLLVDELAAEECVPRQREPFRD